MPIRRIIEPPLPDLRGGDVFQIGTVEKAAIEENGTIAVVVGREVAVIDKIPIALPSQPA